MGMAAQQKARLHLEARYMSHPEARLEPPMRESILDGPRGLPVVPKKRTSSKRRKFVGPREWLPLKVAAAVNVVSDSGIRRPDEFVDSVDESHHVKTNPNFDALLAEDAGAQDGSAQVLV